MWNRPHQEASRRRHQDLRGCARRSGDGAAESTGAFYNRFTRARSATATCGHGRPS